MLWKTFQTKELKAFGGLITYMDRSDLEPFVSGNCQNVEFTPGSVKSRGGTTSSRVVSPVFSGQIVSLGSAYLSGAGGPWVASYFAPDATATSGTLAFSDENGTNLDYVQGLATTSSYGASQFGAYWATFWHNLTGAYWSGVTPPRSYNYLASTKFTRVGLPRPTWGSSAITEVANTGTTLTAGTHLYRVTFEDAFGNTSPISGFLSLVATGGVNTATQITNVPLGPPNTVRRVVWATSATDSGVANTQSYYTLRGSSMVIPDNTTTTAVLAFTDDALTFGESAASNNLFTLMPVPPAKGVVFYKNRAFWYHLGGGVQPVYQDHNSWFDCLEFNADANIALRGWLSAGAGTSVQTGTNGMSKVLRLTADGATATYAVLTSGALSLPSQQPALKQGNQYGLMFRMRSSTNFSQGSVRFTSNISGYTYNFDTVCTGITANWTTYSTGPLLANFDYTTKFPKFTIELIGTASPNGAYVEIEYLQVYDVASQWRTSQVLASRPFTPGTCDGLGGSMLVQKDDGQQIQSAFVLRDNLYFVKTGSIHVTSDNGVGDPNTWSINRVTDVVGAPSPQAVGFGDNWVAIASRDGLYQFDGGGVEKLSEEIQPTWNRINWTFSALITVAVDVANKRIVVSAPIDGSSTPNAQLVMDYLEGFTPCDRAEGHGRKWTIWTVPNAQCVGYLKRSTQVPELFFGTSDAGGDKQLYRYDSTKHSDGTTALTLPINAYYETGPFAVDQGVPLFGGILVWVNGTGTYSLSTTAPNDVNTALTTFAIVNPAPRSWQYGMGASSASVQESLSFRFGTNAADEWFSTRNFTVYLKEHPYMNIRGLNN